MGPEGGFTAGEVAHAARRGLQARLGPRTLRAETAALAALASIEALVDERRFRPGMP